MYVVLILVAIYSLLILFYCIKFRYYHDSIPAISPTIPINIVTAAKNEGENIDKFLSCISSQNYQNGKLVLVDDHSTDNTFSIASDYKKQYDFVLCQNNGNGKKAALRTALTHCNAPYILFTDADCYSNPQWTGIMAASAQHTKADILLAPLIIKADNPKSIFQRLWQTESLAILTLTAGAAIAGHPIMCNGGNMMVKTAFRQKADEHLKYKYPSGDDIFLLQYAISQGKKIVYVKHPDAAVYTHSPQTVGDLIRQRARWAGKTVGYTDIITIAVAAVVLLANIAILAAAALWVADVIRWYMFLILWGIKTIADAFAVIAPANLSNIHVKLHDLILLSLIYPIYTVVCVVRGVIPRSPSDCWRRADG